jgi:hypothetical protein
MTTRNPNSKWDWWVVGGRWDGEIQGSRRSDGEGGFNFGDEHHEADHNVVKVKGILAAGGDEWVPFAIVTPDGEWHERGSMGSFAMVSDKHSKHDWTTEARRIMAQFSGHVAVGVDCHT